MLSRSIGGTPRVDPPELERFLQKAEVENTNPPAPTEHAAAILEALRRSGRRETL